MAFEFNTPAGETIARELLIAYLNTGAAVSPVWSPLGNRTTDSSEEYDWSRESSKDILGKTRTSMKKPVVTQTFDPWELDGGDAAAEKIHQLAVIEQNAQALCNLDMMIAHFYVESGGGNFAERYSACSVEATNLGGEGGGSIGMPITVTYGGERTTGTVSKGVDGAVTFTPDGAGGFEE